MLTGTASWMVARNGTCGIWGLTFISGVTKMFLILQSQRYATSGASVKIHPDSEPFLIMRKLISRIFLICPLLVSTNGTLPVWLLSSMWL